MGAYICSFIKSNRQKADILITEKKPVLSPVLCKQPTTQLKTLTQSSNPSQPNETSQEQLLQQSSPDCTNNTVSSSPIALSRGTGSTITDFLLNVRFLLVDLEYRMDRTSKAMLNTLEPFMMSQLTVVKDFEKLDRIRSNKELRIFIFTTAEFADLLGQISSIGEEIFVLGISTNPLYKIFENIQDLIFQVAEELAQCYGEEVHMHVELGELNLAACKQEIINDMYRQLMDISADD